MAAPVAVVLPLVELVTAALLIPSTSARWGAVAALGLLGIFIGGIAINLARGRKPDCHCFGQIHSAPIGRSTLVRNGILAALATVVVWQGGASPGRASFDTTIHVGAIVWITLVVAVLALALAAIEAWFVLNLLSQQGRVLMRLEKLETALGLGPGSGLPVGRQAPDFELASLGGDRLRLATLRSAGRPILLVFTSPDCAPCNDLLPDIGRWQREHADRVTIAVVSDGPSEFKLGKAEEHGLRTVLLQKEREISKIYDVIGSPAAVLVGADGRIASRVAYTGSGVEGLLQQAVGGAPYAPPQAMPSAGNGHLEPPPAPPASTVAIGQLAPPLALPDLDGKATDLADFQGSSTLVLFWRPSCGFCQQMLPELKKWERKHPAGSPQLLVVSTGTAEENRAMGLTSPVVLDSDGSAMRAFGASGTPMGVLVDADGRIASSVVVGAEEVMTLARTRQREPVGK
jgi:peroxiredoxin